MAEQTRHEGPAGRPAVDADPAVVDAVAQVRDRFGAHGLRDMIELARHELAGVEAALADLARDVGGDEAGGGG